MMAIELPPEILMIIFIYLTPSDLYTISSVCKKFRSILWPKTEISQHIWRKSRLHHIPFLNRSPPKLCTTTSGTEVMSEQQYLWLMIICEKCQFCEQKDKIKLTLYWEAKFYCCSTCLQKRTISGYKLIQGFPKVLIKFLNELPKMPGVANWEPQLYFESEAKRLLEEYNQVREYERDAWIERKESITKETKKEIKIYREFHSEFKYNFREVARKMALEIEAEDYEDKIMGLKEFKNFYCTQLATPSKFIKHTKV
ncbi:hypothetical protein RhiirA5_423072 [Rhizophagus irregularis]|uniref:F-box domain-containing protein n=4 Tax=Rhizophagus irregularis TaxID=588596 RepID=A0A2N0P1W4_9GLOM|nr:hypothetical protein RirG_220360 [Rhizophagus irregularis DAOM 197198w]PKC00814.1 hypothetical protein RhiirA5_427664 [Rhizophagus irregularis]PKC03883.1 hypothetical protein RhiirA5_423072 [Rhizophagus irregularis]UZO07487.1 hypothetical protein OCT59_027771 [Rhizophagus irregularis]CAB4479334.1 unnamed protein product [Rhizophagus irregularis]